MEKHLLTDWILDAVGIKDWDYKLSGSSWNDKFLEMQYCLWYIVYVSI